MTLITFYHCYNGVPERAEIEWGVTAWLCCFFNVFATNENYSFPSANNQLACWLLSSQHVKLFILVLPIVINRIPHFFGASRHSHIIKDQTEKTPHIYFLSLFLTSYRYLLNDSTKKHSFSNRKEQQLETSELVFQVLHSIHRFIKLKPVISSSREKYWPRIWQKVSGKTKAQSRQKPSSQLHKIC